MKSKELQVDAIIKRSTYVSQNSDVQKWLKHLAYYRGITTNSIKTYITAIEKHLQYCDCKNINVVDATTEDLVAYRDDLETRKNVQKRIQGKVRKRQGYSKSTINLWMNTASRYYDFLIWLGKRTHNPIGSRSYTLFGPRKVKGNSSIAPRRSIVEQWQPNDTEWERIIEVVLQEDPREQGLFISSYLLATRCSETCKLEFTHILSKKRVVILPSANTKGNYEREIPVSSVFLEFVRAYRNIMSDNITTSLFVSQSRRNKGQVISASLWQQSIRRIAEKANCPQLHTHTLRHIRLSDLARAGYSLSHIANFAGHRTGDALHRIRGFQRTLGYIQIPSDEVLVPRVETIEEIDNRRVGSIIDLLKRK